jgi:uncharacterized membrane protein YgdD (TMEM256/DUF423 family)
MATFKSYPVHHSPVALPLKVYNLRSRQNLEIRRRPFLSGLVLNVAGQWFALALQTSEVFPSHLPVFMAFEPSSKILV